MKAVGVVQVKFLERGKALQGCLDALVAYTRRGGCADHACTCRRVSFDQVVAVMGQYDAVVVVSSYDFRDIQRTLFGCFRNIPNADLFDTSTQMGMLQHPTEQDTSVAFQLGPMDESVAARHASLLEDAGMDILLVREDDPLPGEPRKQLDSETGLILITALLKSYKYREELWGLLAACVRECGVEVPKGLDANAGLQWMIASGIARIRGDRQPAS